MLGPASARVAESEPALHRPFDTLHVGTAMMQHASRMHCLWRLAAANTDAAAALRPAPAGLQLLISATGTTGSSQHSGIRTQAADAGKIAALHPHNAGEPRRQSSHACLHASAAPCRLLFTGNQHLFLLLLAAAGQPLPQLLLWRQLHSRTRAGTLTPTATAGAPCRPPPQHVAVQQQIRQQRRYAHSQPGPGVTTLNVGSPATALPVGAPSERDAPPSKADAAGEQLPAEASESGAGAPLHAYSADASPAAAPAAPSGTARPVSAGGEAPTSWWDDQGCFEYRAPLSTTVRRLKVSALTTSLYPSYEAAVKPCFAAFVASWRWLGFCHWPGVCRNSLLENA